MKFSIVTIFPEMVKCYLGASILKRAMEKNLITVGVHNLRDYAEGKHRVVDDYPYGGGAGMVMKPEPFFRIVESLWPDKLNRRIILLSPQGSMFTQAKARELSREDRETVFLCGRYEAIDERVRKSLADEEISIGDYVLTGGELPALVIIDAVSRLIPGVLGDEMSAVDDSFSSGLLDHPHYTRPEIFGGMRVPGVLLSGNHAEVLRWRKKEALRTTREKRPELFHMYNPTKEEIEIIKEIKEEKK